MIAMFRYDDAGALHIYDGFREDAFRGADSALPARLSPRYDVAFIQIAIFADAFSRQSPFILIITDAMLCHDTLIWRIFSSPR